MSTYYFPYCHFWHGSWYERSAKPVPVIGLGLLQLLILSGMPIFKLHLGLLLPLCFLLARIFICGDRSRGKRVQESEKETAEGQKNKQKNSGFFCSKTKLMCWMLPSTSSLSLCSSLHLRRLSGSA